MIKNLSTLLRSALAASLLFVSPGFPSYAAAAPIVAGRAAVPGNNFLGTAGAAARRSGAPSLAQAPLLSVNLAPAIALVSALPAPIAAPMTPQSPVSSLQAPPSGMLPAAAADDLREAVSAETPAESAGRSAGRLFDGTNRRDVLSDPEAVRAFASAAPSARLSKRSGASSLGSRAVKAAAGLMLAAPAVALAAGPAAASAALLASAQPIGTVLAAAVGAVYGLIAAARRGDAPPSAGEILASVLRYGIMSGAGMFVLLDVANVLFAGLSTAGLTPLPMAMVAAALGHSAFQGKFDDAATSAADRLMSAFPAIATALGLSIGLVLATPAVPLLLLAVKALSATAVAAAVYAAVYKPGKSSAGGPAAMARGFVMQSLMTGLALSVSGTALTLSFLALAAWGFWLVVSTTLRELSARRN